MLISTPNFGFSWPHLYNCSSYLFEIYFHFCNQFHRTFDPCNLILPENLLNSIAVIFPRLACSFECGKLLIKDPLRGSCLFSVVITLMTNLKEIKLDLLLRLNSRGNALLGNIVKLFLFGATLLRILILSLILYCLRLLHRQNSLIVGLFLFVFLCR